MRVQVYANGAMQMVGELSSCSLDFEPQWENDKYRRLLLVSPVFGHVVCSFNSNKPIVSFLKELAACLSREDESGKPIKLECVYVEKLKLSQIL